MRDLGLRTAFCIVGLVPLDAFLTFCHRSEDVMKWLGGYEGMASAGARLLYM
jgi:hypothetical protein